MKATRTHKCTSKQIYVHGKKTPVKSVKQTALPARCGQQDLVQLLSLVPLGKRAKVGNVLRNGSRAEKVRILHELLDGVKNQAPDNRTNMLAGEQSGQVPTAERVQAAQATTSVQSIAKDRRRLPCTAARQATSRRRTVSPAKGSTAARSSLDTIPYTTSQSSPSCCPEHSEPHTVGPAIVGAGNEHPVTSIMVVFEKWPCESDCPPCTIPFLAFGGLRADCGVPPVGQPCASVRIDVQCSRR